MANRHSWRIAHGKGCITDKNQTMKTDDFQSFESFDAMGTLARIRYNNYCIKHKCMQLYDDLRAAKNREEIISIITKIENIALHNDYISKPSVRGVAANREN